jgi:GTPase Era involved in 16S rRNA processing
MATGKGAAYAGHNLEAHTAQVRSHRVQHPKVKDREIVLVDTPGFDDPDKSDMDILEMVSEWLKTS